MSRLDGERENVMIALAESSRRFANWLEHTRQRTARGLGLHVTDLRCLSLIYDAKEPVNPKRIADELGLSTGSTTAVVDRLEKAGVVRRVPNPNDRRGVLLEANRDATQMAAPVHEQLHNYYSQALSNFSVNELQTVARFLDQMASSKVPDTVSVLGDIRKLPK